MTGKGPIRHAPHRTNTYEDLINSALFPPKHNRYKQSGITTSAQERRKLREAEHDRTRLGCFSKESRVASLLGVMLAFLSPAACLDPPVWLVAGLFHPALMHNRRTVFGYGGLHA